MAAVFNRRSSAVLDVKLLAQAAALQQGVHSNRSSISLARPESRTLGGVTLSDSAADEFSGFPLTDEIGVKDLATLTELTEDAIVKELEKRFRRNLIYTHVGDILIAVNPFKELPELYGEEAFRRYSLDSPPSELPHVFRVAQIAYKSLLQDHKHQCCVISGESGAGKTETAKFLVAHLLALCHGHGQLEQRILMINPLLEAFGNAKTAINDNSSRFGKYLEIKFGFYGEVLGARIQEYLLEKSRVVRQGDGEQNFHRTRWWRSTRRPSVSTTRSTTGCPWPRRARLRAP